MSEAYSGLRKRRKRTHSSKCPCCITDQEVEPENEATVVNENATEVIRESRQSTRKRPIKKRNDKDKSESESEQRETVAQKTLAKKRKLRSSTEDNQQQSITSKKATKTSSRNTGKHVQEIPAKSDKTRTKAKTKKGSYKPYILSKKELINDNSKTSKASEQDSDENIKSEDSDEHCEEHAASKMPKSKVSYRDNKIGKSTKSNVQKAKPRAKSSKEIKHSILKQEFDDNHMNTTSAKKAVSKPVVKRKLPKRVPVEKPSLAFTKTSNKTTKGSALPKVTQLKIAVFDDLYSKLKLTNKDIPIEEAAEMLTAISSENLQIAYKSSQMFENSEKLSGNTSRLEKKRISDTEEIVSQAAEALVSFRVKSPISREDTNLTEKNNSTHPSCISTAAPLVSQAVEKVKPPFSAAASAVQALMQIQCSNSIPSTIVTSMSSSATMTQNNMQVHAVLPTATLSQSFPQLLQPNLTTSFTNLMPMVSSHGTLPSFSQIAAQLRPQPPISAISNTIPTNQNISGVTPSPLITPTLSSQSLPSPSLILPNQTLIQPQLQQAVSLSSLVTSCKPSLTTVPSNTVQSNTVPSMESNKANTHKHNQLQQPLKGLEEVIGNVGTNVPPQPILWNIKSPVVFLGSPQNLGGVPRNLVTSPSTSQSGTSLEKSGYRPVAPKPVSKPDNSHVTSAPLSSVPNVLTLGGRPILPRTQLQAGDDGQKLQTPQSGLSFVPHLSAINPSNPYQASTLQALTQVTSANPKKTTLMSVNLSNASPPVGQPLGTFLQQNIQSENSSIQCSSPSAVSAKQAVKKLVHERTKSAELKKEVMGVHTTTKLKTILPLPPKEPPTSSVISSESTSKNNEFNLEQAATALLSIGVPEGIETIGLKQGPSDPSKDDYEEDVVFTSKGTFRVGDVDVDPRYNRIGREGYTCGKCNKIFTSLSYLARHIKRVCPDMSCRKWKCTLCDKAFRHPFGLQQHVYTHTGERPHKCPLCPKAFYSSNDLRRHSRIHSGERPYRCKHCDKSFATTISLKTHTYIHTGEKPHKCPQCPKTFATSSKLGRHIVTHSEQRPYSCDQCPKSFNRSGDLRRHNLAVHDGKDKSFDCDVCSATFTKSADLRRHNATIHQNTVKTLQCEDCNTQFTTPLCLKMHRDTYHKKASSIDSEKAYTCDVCGKTYSSTALLTKHKATHEPSSTSGYNLSQFQHIAPKPTEQITNKEMNG